MADDSISFSLVGVNQLVSTLNTLKDDVKRKGGRFALRKAANLVAERIRANAERLDDAETGRNIADNVAVRWNGREFKRNGNLGFRVGILQGAVLPKGGEPADTSQGAATPHWRLLEFGTEKMPAQPFVRPAAENNVGEIVNEFITQYEKALTRAIRRANKTGISITR